jgi:hypothetical protein
MLACNLTIVCDDHRLDAFYAIQTGKKQVWNLTKGMTILLLWQYTSYSLWQVWIRCYREIHLIISLNSEVLPYGKLNLPRHPSAAVVLMGMIEGTSCTLTLVCKQFNARSKVFSGNQFLKNIHVLYHQGLMWWLMPLSIYIRRNHTPFTLDHTQCS